jgi:hypothetical protein
MKMNESNRIINQSNARAKLGVRKFKARTATAATVDFSSASRRSRMGLDLPVGTTSGVLGGSIKWSSLLLLIDAEAR